MKRSFSERAMGMSDAVWQRHANPWSFYTRIPILPALACAVFFRDALGWWTLAIVAALAVWTFLNPRLFPPPKETTSYAARGVRGERIWLARKTDPIPAHQARAAAVLVAVSACGVPVLAYGLFVLNPWATLSGLLLTVGGKLWFVDRMVWLYDETPPEARPPGV